ncbi:hypothetical protein QYE76_038193 [Lolium multiflorum]|uniref:Gag-pol polyprotein n=1 Tax=Lolium multiflorum TaxID=4521 RepID=A0AAD8T724_LOLMU|nr:hypothetical protein QYE76_038193 [Lolium multiflorum]
MIQEVMKYQHPLLGPALGTYQGEVPLQSRPSSSFASAAPEISISPSCAVDSVEDAYPGRCQPRNSFNINMVELGHHPDKGIDEGSCSHSRHEEKAALCERPRHRQNILVMIKVEADASNRPVVSVSPVLPVCGVDLTEKKDGRWRVAIDFRDLNRATPKDEYPVPVETLINAAAGHKVLSFMDGNAGYNQIFMAWKIYTRPHSEYQGVGLFEYVVMTFGLKNAGATYQRAMNYIFHDLIGKLVEIYIDNVVVKSVSTEGHLDDLRRVLDRTRKFGLRMNPKKCAFGVTAGQFLGFLVHERGVEIGLKSQEAVRTMQPPTTKKELQRLIGKINFVRRFISNLSGRIEPFMALVKTKSMTNSRGTAAFDEIKRYLTTPPVLVPPRQDRPFYIYLSVADTSIASVVVQLYEGVEKVVFYLSRRMLDAETRYPEVEKLCLCLFFTTKLHHILLTAEIFIICKSDIVKHMLSAPVLKGRLGRWKGYYSSAWAN